jgi:hypothetical protein
MGARIVPFFEKVTETFSYLVIDPPTQAAAILKPRVCRSNGIWRRTSMPTIFRRRAI